MRDLFPDWRDEEVYPESFSELERQEWGWEFLRRNDRYRQDWEKHKNDENFHLFLNNTSDSFLAKK